jgi:hypothetical protein
VTVRLTFGEQTARLRGWPSSSIPEALRRARADWQRRLAETFPDGAERLAAADEADALEEQELSDADTQRAFRTSMACSVAREGLAEAAYLDRLCSAPTNHEVASAAR